MLAAAPRSALIISRNASTWWPPASTVAAPSPSLPSLLGAGCGSVISRVFGLDESGEIHHAAGADQRRCRTSTTKNRNRLGMAVPDGRAARAESGRDSNRHVILDDSLPHRQARPVQAVALTERRRKRLIPSPNTARFARREPCQDRRPPADSREPLETRVARLSTAAPLVMVGMMGAGKSSVGRRLANRLGLPFVDADTEIETAANATITEIFERHGEAYFRDGERRVIQRLLDGTPKVLATGGGAFVQPETRAAIQRDAHLDLAEGRPRPAPVAGQAPREPAAAEGRRPRRDHRPADRGTLSALRGGRDPRAIARRRPRRRHRRYPVRARRLSRAARRRKRPDPMVEAATRSRGPADRHRRSRPALLRHPDRPRPRSTAPATRSSRGCRGARRDRHRRDRRRTPPPHPRSTAWTLPASTTSP